MFIRWSSHPVKNLISYLELKLKSFSGKIQSVLSSMSRVATVKATPLLPLLSHSLLVVAAVGWF